MKPTHIHRLKLTLFFICLLFGSASPLVAAPTAVTASGNPNLLLGFDNMIVDGITYSVRFEDGTFATVFPDGLDFNNETAALAASNALLNAFNLFLAFDNNPAQTNGCTLSPSFCVLATPYEFVTIITNTHISLQVFNNQLPPFADGVSFTNFITTTDDTANLPSFVYADWLRTPQAVPEPAAIWLIGAGLLGLWGVQRKSVQV